MDLGTCSHSLSAESGAQSSDITSGQRRDRHWAGASDLPPGAQLPRGEHRDAAGSVEPPFLGFKYGTFLMLKSLTKSCGDRGEIALSGTLGHQSHLVSCLLPCPQAKARLLWDA